MWLGRRVAAPVEARARVRLVVLRITSSAFGMAGEVTLKCKRQPGKYVSYASWPSNRHHAPSPSRRHPLADIGGSHAHRTGRRARGQRVQASRSAGVRTDLRSPPRSSPASPRAPHRPRERVPGRAPLSQVHDRDTPGAGRPIASAMRRPARSVVGVSVLGWPRPRSPPQPPRDRGTRRPSSWGAGGRRARRAAGSRWGC